MSASYAIEPDDDRSERLERAVASAANGGDAVGLGREGLDHIRRGAQDGPGCAKDESPGITDD